MAGTLKAEQQREKLVSNYVEKDARKYGGFASAPAGVAIMKRLDERKIPYTTIKHEILTTITTHDPNGITLELSKWNVDPKKVRM